MKINIFLLLLLIGLSLVPFTTAAPNQTSPNVVLMIGDGMGPEQIKLASLVEYGTPNGSIMQTEFPIASQYVTNNIDGKITDSAAGGSAIATGQLTANGVISMDETKSIRVKTILEYLKDDFGYATGLITTTEFAHATPAVFGSHTTNRDNKEAIRDQLLSSGIDLILGGGKEVSYVGGADAAKSLGESYGYTTITSRNELLTIPLSSSKIFGVFGTTNMPYELERDPSIDPSIVEMTDKGLEFLSQKGNPFFLMIEGGRIDHAGHMVNSNENKTLYNVMETIMFEKAVRRVLDFAKQDGNTIVVVAADHETGGLQVYDYSGLDATLPSEDLSRDENNQIRMRRVAEINASFSTNSHTDTPVYFFGYGSDFGDVIVDTIDDVFWAINGALGKFPTVRNDRFTIEDTTIKYSFEIMDLDNSAESYEIVQIFENGTKLSSGNISIADLSQNNQFEYSFPSPETNDSVVFFVKVHDSSISISSLSKTYLSLPPTNQATTDQTTDLNFPIWVICLSSIPLIRRKTGKKFLKMLH